MIRVEALTKTFTANKDVVAAVDGIDFEVGAGEMVTLLGPSGCGKTTTLRCVAGLERSDSGRIVIGNQTMVDVAAGIFVPPNRRNLGMVFQSYAIWPHMTVLENVAYALEGQRMAKAERHRLAMAALETVKLAHLADRPAPRLSGGQQQRVAIARAVVGKPQVLLFDEPLSNLDARLRMEMRGELRRIQKQIGLSSIYVTHDQSEALAVSDWIVVMKDGRVVERGRPLDIYRYPRHVFTAQFLGTTNLIAGDGRDRRRRRRPASSEDGAWTDHRHRSEWCARIGREGEGKHPPGGFVHAGGRWHSQRDRRPARVCDLRGRVGRGRGQRRRGYPLPACSTARPTLRPAARSRCAPGRMRV